ncbi:unnamed protein product [Cochlearia groenlandica]
MSSPFSHPDKPSHETSLLQSRLTIKTPNQRKRLRKLLSMNPRAATTPPLATSNALDVKEWYITQEIVPTRKFLSLLTMERLCLKILILSKKKKRTKRPQLLER